MPLYPPGGISIGGAVTGGAASRVLYEGAGPVLADSANMTFDGSKFSVLSELAGGGASANLPLEIRKNAGSNSLQQWNDAAGSITYFEVTASGYMQAYPSNISFDQYILADTLFSAAGSGYGSSFLTPGGVFASVISLLPPTDPKTVGFDSLIALNYGVVGGAMIADLIRGTSGILADSRIRHSDLHHLVIQQNVLDSVTSSDDVIPSLSDGEIAMQFGVHYAGTVPIWSVGIANNLTSSRFSVTYVDGGFGSGVDDLFFQILGTGTNYGVFESYNTADFYISTGSCPISFSPSRTLRMRLDTSGRLGIGQSSPTAVLHLKAGTASANTGPLKFTSGTNLTTPEAGTAEFDGSNLYFSPSTTRKRVALTNNATPTNGQLPIGNGTDYTVASLTAGANITITPGAGSITIAATGGGVSDGDKGDITVSGGGATWTIDNDVVTYAKMQNVSATNRILGRSTAGAGDVEEITVGGDISQSGSTFTIANDAVTNAKLRDSAGVSVIGRSANSTGDPADIAAAADGDVLRRGAGVLGFGAIPEASVTNLVSDLAAKASTATTISTVAPLSGGGDLSANRTITTSMATGKLIGRGTAGTGVMEEITLGSGLSFSSTTLLSEGISRGKVVALMTGNYIT